MEVGVRAAGIAHSRTDPRAEGVAVDETEVLQRRIVDLEERVAKLEAALAASRAKADANLKETIRIVSEIAAAVGIKIEVEGGIPGEAQTRRATD